MRSFTLPVILCTTLIACNPATHQQQDTTINSTKSVTLDSPALSKADTLNQVKVQPLMNKAQKLALTSNALQLVDTQTGSTREIEFGKPLDEMVELLNRVLGQTVKAININYECGAGPLKMANWSNGLTVVFEQKKLQSGKGEWQFWGWFASEGTIPSTLTTMAGIGVGSSRSEMEAAYTIKVVKTSLGQEFSTSSGLYGIFSGTGKTAKITNMWSGVSCNFR